MSAHDQSASQRARHLRALLEGHVPADAEEARHLQRMGALLDAAGDPFARDHFDPGHFTASAFVLAPQGDALLLIFHGKLERWLQPGGHVEPGDHDIHAAALREVAEEVGLDDLELLREGPLDLDVHDIPARKSDPGHAHFDVRFALRARSTDVRAGSDAHDARWVALDAIEAIESDRSVVRAVQKLRAW